MGKCSVVVGMPQGQRSRHWVKTEDVSRAWVLADHMPVLVFRCGSHSTATWMSLGNTGCCVQR